MAHESDPRFNRIDPTPADIAARPLGEALIDLVDQLEPGELLSSITPEALGAAAGFSASTVRYRLRQVRECREPTRDEVGGSWSFDRALLLEVMTDALFTRLIETSASSLAGYLELLQQAVDTADIAPLTRALTQDLESFSPGATEPDTGGGADRARLLLITACEGSPALSRRVRSHYLRWIATYEPFYALLLRLTERRLREGVAIADLADPISMFLQGLAERRRFDPALNPEMALRTFLAIFCAWTRPVGDASPDSVDQLIARFVPQAPVP